MLQLFDHSVTVQHTYSTLQYASITLFNLLCSNVYISCHVCSVFHIKRWRHLFLFLFVSLNVMFCLSHQSFLYHHRDHRVKAHFSLSFFSSVLLFPSLRAEEPQCLLLAFSYHLSPFHHHHYLPLLSVIYSLPSLPQPFPLPSSHTPFVCFSLILFSISCRRLVSSAPQTHNPTFLF